ncbi:alanine--tRNA ligase [Methanothermobacter thermautotrophicus]|uniref:alanine--tRNA ligase n=1 Tax=Methanothermobacter thermautotrophicus TaxID=145262 RepID=UPI0022B9813C|nr:alanine--tRNA ligase [Methanothermobacter thermautotrophicus]WBF07953.1 alanine--tRNA ligase [Methanothermobacter thermautotrophicus]
MITMSHQLEKLGYRKYECRSCGNTFWSMKERATCGDAPCDEYGFIGNPATDRSYDLYEIQDKFMEFFAERGHEPIRRYPVLAKRWRDDVFLVGASIYNFQPWVTSGLVKPPANPLVVAQPSIRLNDVDNVGRTGRHLTCFTMGGHHAFNSEDNTVYWEEETIKYCHDFLTHIGIDPSEITFIESWWQGGGNEGPCYEVCVRGVELATLVFIQYRTLPDGGREEIPLKIVDTGYGLERFAWISQGTPTAYDACLGPVIEKLVELTGVKIDEEILAENAQVAGMMDIETYADLRELRKRVADKLGISVEELERAAAPMESVYAIADHTRCLAFMLADGVIPSNVKEGYLARLIIRRTLRLMKDLGMKESLKDIMNIQVEFLEGHYPEIRSHHEHILNIIDLEEHRYARTVKRGRRIVEKTIRYLKRDGKAEMPLEILIKLYDSHGIPPETIGEIAEESGFQVKIPDNFYTLVAERNETETDMPEEDVHLDYPATELLFYDEPDGMEFQAEVIGIHENGLILDRTLFYPEGGGQPSDTGYITAEGCRLRIKHAEKIGAVVVHRTDDEICIEPGTTIRGFIDSDRRLQLTRNHTATHLIVSAARKVLGDHIWQAGAQKGVKSSRIDLSHYRRITLEELQEIERLANEYVMMNVPLKVRWMDRDLAERKYGFILYQGGVVPGSRIRVVEIPGVDVQACAGTHVHRTGDVGLIRINRTERIQDGVERIEFSAGSAAIELMQKTGDILRESSDIFKVTPSQLPGTCERFFTEWKALRNEVSRLKEKVASLKILEMKDRAERINDLTVIIDTVDADMDEMKNMALELSATVDAVVLANPEGKIVGAASEDAVKAGLRINEVISQAAAVLGGGGGGRPHLAQGAGPATDKVDEALEEARAALSTMRN